MKMRSAVLSVVALAILALAASSAPAATAFHLKLDKSAPEADQVLDASPEKIVLEFSEMPELAVSRISLKGSAGDAKLSDVARNEEDETILWVAVEEPLADGVYTVNWTTSSGDGHPIRGEFSFTVNTAH